MQIAISPSLPHHLPLYSDLPCGRVTTLAFHTTLDGSSPTFASPSLLPFPSSALHCLCAGAPSATKQHCGPSPSLLPSLSGGAWGGDHGYSQAAWAQAQPHRHRCREGEREEGEGPAADYMCNLGYKHQMNGVWTSAGLDSSVGNYRKPVKFTVFSVVRDTKNRSVFWYISV